VGQPANSMYVSIQFEGSLVTARLGADRHDLFARMRLGESEPTFTAAYDGGVADHRLPFASCA